MISGGKEQDLSVGMAVSQTAACEPDWDSNSARTKVGSSTRSQK